MYNYADTIETVKWRFYNLKAVVDWILFSVYSWDMKLAIENAKSVPIKNDNEIIGVFEQGYCVDKQRGIRNPEGMEGALLEVDVQIVTGASTHLNNLAKAIQRPGFHIDGMLYGLVPLGEQVLLQDEKENGVYIIAFIHNAYVDKLRFTRNGNEGLTYPYRCIRIQQLSKRYYRYGLRLYAVYGYAYLYRFDEDGQKLRRSK